MATKNHDLEDFLRSTADDMSREYERIRKRATEDPGTAGDEGEGNWATLFRNWLPPSVHVVTKGRILTVDGVAGPQVDVVVLHPAYPKSLLDKKVYLAGGVVAAFECKLTLKANHINKFVQNGVAIRRALPVREGSPYKELFSPIIYGMLAHSHVWKGARSKPIEKVSETLFEADRSHVAHPREMIDLICVADLATWTSTRRSWFGPRMIRDWSPMAPIYGPAGSATTAYVARPDETSKKATEFGPIGLAITHILKRIAWEDESLRGLARYFELAIRFGTGKGRMRFWGQEIYSEQLRSRVTSGRLTNGAIWDEWSVGFG
jgi:hypothetical protein